MAPARRARRSRDRLAPGDADAATTKIAPMRRAGGFGPYGSALPGPGRRTPLRTPRRAEDRADVARVVDAVQVDADRAERRRRETAPRRWPARVCRRRARRRSPAPPHRPRAPAARCPRRRTARPASSRSHRPRRVGPRPRPRTGRRARGPGGGPATCGSSFSFSLWGLVIAGMSGEVSRVGLVQQKGRRSFRSGAQVAVLDVGFAQPAASASRARSAKRRKVSASRTAMSARILRSSSTFASWRPCMNWE